MRYTFAAFPATNIPMRHKRALRCKQRTLSARNEEAIYINME